MRRCVSRFHDGDEFGRRRLGERYGFNLSECIGTSLLLPKVDPVISDDTFAYEESEIRFCGQKTRFDLERLVAALTVESTDSLPWIPP